MHIRTVRHPLNRSLHKIDHQGDAGRRLCRHLDNADAPYLGQPGNRRVRACDEPPMMGVQNDAVIADKASKLLAIRPFPHDVPRKAGFSAAGASGDQ